MSVILPIICFCSIFLVIRNFQIFGWRGSFLFAAVVWGILLTIITEFLSLLDWIEFWKAVSAWIFFVLIFLLFFFFTRLKQKKLRLSLNLISLSRFDIALLLYLFLIVLAIGLIAWGAPPNNWDSMTYHMSRVMHWIQNNNVKLFPTSNIRQLSMNPWSEFAIMQFQILSDGDHFANFIQWFSMVSSILGVSLLAKEFNANRRGQVFAAVACATIPMGILQGSSTQTDFVLSFWLVCFVYFVIQFNKKSNLINVFGLGAALGLGILTKATMYIYATPFLAWLVLASIRNRKYKNIQFIFLALIITFIMNIGHFSRNYILSGNLLGPNSSAYHNENFNISILTSNILRNIGLHLGTPFSQINVGEYDAIIYLHTLIEFSPNDESTTYLNTEFNIPNLSFHEDYAGNLIHIILIGTVLILYIIQKPRDLQILPFILALILGFLLFCSYLKWQPWNSRLHLPLFVLFSTCIGLIFSNKRYERIGNPIMIGLLFFALPWVFFNSSRPLLGENSILTTSRIDQYFANRKLIYKSYDGSTQLLSDMHCSDIGLIISEDDWEYPIWVLMREKTKNDVHIEHVNVENISESNYGENSLNKFTPCAIFTENTDLINGVIIGESVYSQKWPFNSVVVYTQTSNP